MRQCMVTTMDNKWNPFTQYDEWLAYDNEMHYKTCELLAFYSKADTSLDEEAYNEETSKAIDRLLEFNPYGIHMKVYEDEASTLIPLANKAFEEMNKAMAS